VDLVKAFQGAKVLVIGDIMLDEYVMGIATRLSPEAPVPVVEIQQRNYVLGGAANVAANIRSLGATVFLGGVIGDDLHGKIIQRELTTKGIETNGIVIVNDRPTTVKTRIVVGHQQVVRLDSERPKTLEQAEEEILIKWFRKVVSVSDVCVISDYAKGVITSKMANQAINYANETKKSIIVDPKGFDYTKYIGATILTPNLSEAIQAADLGKDNVIDVEKAGQYLLAILPNSCILITQGAEGMSLFLRDKNDEVRLCQISTEPRRVYDVSGAGDTVVSMIALALAVGFNLEDASQLANYAAGIVVGKPGTATITIEELLGFNTKTISSTINTKVCVNIKQ
jgi:D-glycero-beta-D-manno-heptose-7-phosphate kinase